MGLCGVAVRGPILFGKDNVGVPSRFAETSRRCLEDVSYPSTWAETRRVLTGCDPELETLTYSPEISYTPEQHVHHTSALRPLPFPLDCVPLSHPPSFLPPSACEKNRGAGIKTRKVCESLAPVFWGLYSCDINPLPDGLPEQPNNPTRTAHLLSTTPHIILLGGNLHTGAHARDSSEHVIQEETPMSFVPVPYERTQTGTRRNFYLSDELSPTINFTRRAHTFSTTRDPPA